MKPQLGTGEIRAPIPPQTPPFREKLILRLSSQLNTEQQAGQVKTPS